MILNDISQAITKPEELIHVHLEPSKGWAPLKVRELWEYRELFYFLTWRDVKVRYKQAAPGCCLGDPATVLNHGGLQPVFWQAGTNAV